MFFIDVLRQNKKVQSDIRESVQNYRKAAPVIFARGKSYRTNLNKSLPQCKGTRSTARKRWLSNVRKVKKAGMKIVRGRGSTSHCLAHFACCSKGQAQMPRNAETCKLVEQKYGQKKALCLSCQRRLFELNGSV